MEASKHSCTSGVLGEPFPLAGYISRPILIFFKEVDSMCLAVSTYIARGQVCISLAFQKGLTSIGRQGDGHRAEDGVKDFLACNGQIKTSMKRMPS